MEGMAVSLLVLGASEHQDKGHGTRETELVGFSRMKFSMAMFHVMHLETKTNSFFSNLEKISVVLVNHRKAMSRSWALCVWR